MKILHVTESMAAGVGQYLIMVSNEQSRSGHEIVVAHSERPETPVSQLDQLFDQSVRRVVVPMVTAPSMKADLKALQQLIAIIKNELPDVVHLHSSKAGVLGRIAAKLVHSKAKLFYSPHGFAFLRQDVSALKRAVFLMFEKLAGLCGGCLVACSSSEAFLATERLRSPLVKTVENAIDRSDLLPWSGGNKQRVQIINSGRATFVKNPDLFTEVATACLDLPARFKWVGGGELEETLKAQQLENFEITGWMHRPEVMKYVASADIFLMTSISEAMPLALIEAQATGLPAVVADVFGCRDVVIDGETGFICKTTDDLIAKTRLLIENPDLRRKLGENAASRAKTRFDVARLNRELLELYQSPL